MLIIVLVKKNSLFLPLQDWLAEHTSYHVVMPSQSSSAKFYAERRHKGPKMVDPHRWEISTGTVYTLSAYVSKTKIDGSAQVGYQIMHTIAVQPSFMRRGVKKGLNWWIHTSRIAVIRVYC
jgi:hypothetical protein